MADVTHRDRPVESTQFVCGCREGATVPAIARR
jgi:hypothetical protein